MPLFFSLKNILLKTFSYRSGLSESSENLAISDDKARKVVDVGWGGGGLIDV